MRESDGAAIREMIVAVPGVPCLDGGPVFNEPWQAQAFAMAIHLEQRGVFTWAAWAQTLGNEIERARKAGDPDDGSTYYVHWLTTLERLVSESGIASRDTLSAFADAWGRAAQRTKHGQPIVLSAADVV